MNSGEYDTKGLSTEWFEWFGLHELHISRKYKGKGDPQLVQPRAI
jgi:hypothetical protein